MSYVTPDSLKQQLNGIVRVWSANPDLTLRGITLAELKADVLEYSNIVSRIDEQEAILSPLRNDRDALAERLSRIAVRARLTIRGTCGLDANEVELVGGTRAMDRKKPQRAADAAPTTAGEEVRKAA